MITPGKIDEWIREVQERPESAPTIIRYISNRLRDLSERNEELQNENIALVSEKKVEQYKARIERLEYQLGLLKRQVSIGEGGTETDGINLLVFSRQGGVLRRQIDPLNDLIPGQTIATISNISPVGGSLQLISLSEGEELLFIFNSGRTVRMPLDEVPLVLGKEFDWKAAYPVETRGSETIISVLPIAKMSLYEFAVHISRKGYAKKATEKYFQTYVAKDNIGTGVKLAIDESLGVVLCNARDILVLISREGDLLAIQAEQVPVAIHEVFKLAASDHVVSAFILRRNQEISLLTNLGTIFCYSPNWLEDGLLDKPLKKALFSKLKRAEGLRVQAASPAERKDFGLVLTERGELLGLPLEKIKPSGTKMPGIADGQTALDYTVIQGQAS